MWFLEQCKGFLRLFDWCFSNKTGKLSPLHEILHETRIFCAQVLGINRSWHLMAAHGHSSVVSQLASNISLREVKNSCSDNHNTTCRFRPTVSLRGPPKYRVQLKICQLSQGLKNDSNLRFVLAFRSRPRKLTTSQGTTKLITRCEYGSKGGGDDSVGGDARVQQMLVEMVQIQIGKSRMSDFVDERSQHMRNIAQDTFDQYDRIAYRTMKGLDASGSRVSRAANVSTPYCVPFGALGYVYLFRRFYRVHSQLHLKGLQWTSIPNLTIAYQCMSSFIGGTFCIREWGSNNTSLIPTGHHLIFWCTYM